MKYKKHAVSLYHVLNSLEPIQLLWSAKESVKYVAYPSNKNHLVLDI